MVASYAAKFVEVLQDFFSFWYLEFPPTYSLASQSHTYLNSSGGSQASWAKSLAEGSFTVSLATTLLRHTHQVPGIEMLYSFHMHDDMKKKPHPIFYSPK